MFQLGNLAEQQTPLLTDLHAAAPGLNKLASNLPAFNNGTEQSLTSLGGAAPRSARRLSRNSQDEIAALDQASTKAYPAADQVAQFLESISDPKNAVEEDSCARYDLRQQPGQADQRVQQLDQKLSTIALHGDQTAPCKWANGAPPARIRTAATRATPEWRASSTTPTSRRTPSTCSTSSATRSASPWSSAPRVQCAMRLPDRPDSCRRRAAGRRPTRGSSPSAPGSLATSSPASITAPTPRASSATSAATTRASARTAATQLSICNPADPPHSASGLRSATAAPAQPQQAPAGAPGVADPRLAEADRQDPQAASTRTTSRTRSRRSSRSFFRREPRCRSCPRRPVAPAAAAARREWA